jgi:hypothetical protein
MSREDIEARRAWDPDCTGLFAGGRVGGFRKVDGVAPDPRS